MNTEKVGRKEKQSKREKDLQQIIGRMKKQIEKLQEVIKMVCNSIVQDKAIRQEVQHQLERIEEETRTNTNKNIDISANENNTNDKDQENEDKEKVRKLGRVRRHP